MAATLTPHRDLPLWARLKPDIRALAKRPTMATNVLLRAFGVEVPPVDVKAIATKLGVAVHQVREPGWAGAIQWKDNTPYIFLKGDDPEGRQRFTLAHELGHLFLHDDGAMFRDNARFSGDAREAEANRFAAALLMPMWMLEPLVVRTSRSLEDLAQIFGVSGEAMTYQLENLK